MAYLQSLVLGRFGGAPLFLASTADRGGFTTADSAMPYSGATVRQCTVVVLPHPTRCIPACTLRLKARLISLSACQRCSAPKPAQPWLRYSYQFFSKNFATTSLPRCKDRFAGSTQESLFRRKALTEPPASQTSNRIDFVLHVEGGIGHCRKEKRMGLRCNMPHRWRFNLLEQPAWPAHMQGTKLTLSSTTSYQRRAIMPPQNPERHLCLHPWQQKSNISHRSAQFS